MEKEGLERGVTLLKKEGLVIGTMVTDRHLQISKWARTAMPDTDHRYDVWHVAKCNYNNVLQLLH